MYHRSFEDLSVQQVQLPRSMNGPRIHDKDNDSRLHLVSKQPLCGNERRTSITLTLRRDKQLELLKGFMQG